MAEKVTIMEYDAVHGFANFGEMDFEKNGGYAAKMRCKKCGAAWLDVNHQNGYDTCPECGTNSRRHIIAM